MCSWLGPEMGHSVKELIRKCHSINPFLRQLPPDLGYYHYTAGREEFFFRRSRKIYYYGMNEQSGTDNYSVGIRQVPKSRTSSNGIELGLWRAQTGSWFFVTWYRPLGVGSWSQAILLRIKARSEKYSGRPLTNGFLRPNSESPDSASCCQRGWYS